jgi:hypothetical protein
MIPVAVTVKCCECGAEASGLQTLKLAAGEWLTCRSGPLYPRDSRHTHSGRGVLSSQSPTPSIIITIYYLIPGRTRKDNTKMSLAETRWEGEHWIRQAKNRDQWTAVVNTAMNIRLGILDRRENLLTRRVMISFTTSSLFHGVSFFLVCLRTLVTEDGCLLGCCAV